MRYNQTFHPQQQDDKYQSISSNAFGTGRFAEIRPKQITFQGTESQQSNYFDPAKASQNTVSFHKSNESNTQSLAKFGSQFDQQKGLNEQSNFQQQQQQQQFSSSGSGKKQGASNKYFQNSVHQFNSRNSVQQFISKYSIFFKLSKIQGNAKVCDQHQNPAKFICATVGCLEGGLCEQCSHQCPNIVSADDYFKIIELKTGSMQLDTVQIGKQRMFEQISEYFNQIKQEILYQIDDLQMKFICKVINETSFNIDLSHQFMQELSEIDLNQLSQQVSQLSKLIYNDHIKMQELKKIFVYDEVRFQKKLQKNVDVLNQLFSNFVFCCQQQLLNDVYDPSLVNLRLLEEQSQYHTSKTCQNQMKSLKRLKIVNTKNDGKPIVDLCLVSNTLMASAEENGEIILWKLPYFVPIHKFQHGVECTSLAAMKDNLQSQFLLSAGKERDEYQIYLWNVDLRSRVGEVIGHSKQLRKIVPLPLSQIAWCQEDSIIRIWRLSEKQQVHEINIHSAWINDLCKISKNQIASCSRDYTVAVIDFYTGQKKFIIKDVAYVNCLTSINSELFAFANQNGQVKIYQVEQPQLISQIQVSQGWLETTSIWFIHRISNEILAVSSSNGEISLISIDQKKDFIIKTIPAQKNKIINAQPLLYAPQFKFLLIPNQEEIQVFQ